MPYEKVKKNAREFGNDVLMEKKNTKGFWNILSDPNLRFPFKFSWK